MKWGGDMAQEPYFIELCWQDFLARVEEYRRLRLEESRLRAKLLASNAQVRALKAVLRRNGYEQD